MQHPAPHDVASHTQLPPTQCCPVAHGPPVPHEHAPAVHRSERTSQAMHTLPPVPHAATVGGDEHVAPEQQPLAQLVALQLVQAPPAHVLPPVHVAQAAPPEPHDASLVPARHVVP